MSSRFAIAKDKALMSLDEIVVELFGGGRRTHKHASRWGVVNPSRAGATVDQMSVWRDAGRKGAWRDYVSGERGDVIDLVAFRLAGIVTADSRMQALEWIEDRFGIRNMSAEQRQPLEAQARANAQKAEHQAEQRGTADRDRARKFFHACEASIIGTPAELYLRSRGIELADVPNLSAAFRYRAECEYWMGGQRDGEGHAIGHKPTFPALVSAMVTGEGHLRACHYTFLEPDGSSKLDTRRRGYLGDNGKGKSAKLMFPSTSGLTIPVTFGPSGLAVKAAAEKNERGFVGLTEGIEDALSVAVANSELRMHAAGSLSGLLGVADLPCATAYVVFKDNDWGKAQALESFDRAVSRLRSFGKPVTIVAMPADWGKDVNDALNQEN